MRQSTIAFRNNSLEYSLPVNKTPLPQTQTESTETSRLRVRVFQLENEVAALKVRVRELEETNGNSRLDRRHQFFKYNICSLFGSVNRLKFAKWVLRLLLLKI